MGYFAGFFGFIFLVAIAAKALSLVISALKPAPPSHEVCRHCSQLVTLYMGHCPACKQMNIPGGHSEPAQSGVSCPHGHGVLRECDQKLRCFECGWPYR